MSRRAEDELAAAACRALVRGETAEAKKLAAQFLAAESERAAGARASAAERKRRSRAAPHVTPKQRDIERDAGVTSSETNGVTNGVTSAVTNPFPPRSPSYPDQKAAAAGSRSESEDARKPALLLTSGTISAAWHKAAAEAGPIVLHAEHAWRVDYETMRAGLCAEYPEETRAEAATMLCRWAWIAADGPYQSGRVRNLTPRHVARNITSDIKAADRWYSSLGGAP